MQHLHEAWLLFVLAEAGVQNAGRVRVWRGLKALGPAVLRDGVYLLPARPEVERALAEQLREVKRGGGQAFIFPFTAADTDVPVLRGFFDRAADFTTLGAALRRFAGEACQLSTEADARRALRTLRREYTALAATNYFSDRAQDLAASALAQADAAFTQRFSPGEPHPAQRAITRLNRGDYQHRLWATRKRLWVDRVASAWLIRSFIDPHATFTWLADARDCPLDAVGFDFDDAAFTHVGTAVTFEVLLHSFGLDDDRGLVLLGEMVHSLDIADALRSAEAAGFEALLTGARDQCANDDELLEAMSRPLSFLLAAFTLRAAASRADDTPKNGDI